VYCFLLNLFFNVSRVILQKKIWIHEQVWYVHWLSFKKLCCGLTTNIGNFNLINLMRILDNWCIEIANFIFHSIFVHSWESCFLQNSFSNLFAHQQPCGIWNVVVVLHLHALKIALKAIWTHWKFQDLENKLYECGTINVIQLAAPSSKL